MSKYKKYILIRNLKTKVNTFSKHLICIIFLFFSLSQFSIGQNTNTESKTDTSFVKIHSPKKASIFSAVCPGLGQAYNKKYWKIPVIYVGFGVLGYFAVTNNNEYKIYKEAYNLRTDNDSTTIDNYSNYSADNLLTIKNYYRKNLELTVIISAALYILNIVDASVDAHLYDFDISDDLSMKIEPILINTSYASRKPNPGLKLTLTLK